jgi:hypothetical protein
MEYTLFCTDFRGNDFAFSVGKYDSLLDCLDALADCYLLDDDGAVTFSLAPGAFAKWGVVSEGGMEMAVKRG